MCPVVVTGVRSPNDAFLMVIRPDMMSRIPPDAADLDEIHCDWLFRPHTLHGQLISSNIQPNVARDSDDNDLHGSTLGEDARHRRLIFISGLDLATSTTS